MVTTADLNYACALIVLSRGRLVRVEAPTATNRFCSFVIEVDGESAGRLSGLYNSEQLEVNLASFVRVQKKLRRAIQSVRESGGSSWPA